MNIFGRRRNKGNTVSRKGEKQFLQLLISDQKNFRIVFPITSDIILWLLTLQRDRSDSA